MLYKIQLKNADDVVLLDDKVYKFLTTDPHMVKIDIINNLRRHSSGCAVFQKTWPKGKGEGYKTETIYLHKLVAEKFLKRQRTKTKNLVGCKNGNKLDCRLENVQWRSRSVASRQRKTSSKVGYTGVYQENHRFRAVISIDRKSVHIGMFPTAEEAAMAYNKMSRELYGEDGKINIIKKATSDAMEKAAQAARKAASTKAKKATTTRAKSTTATKKSTAKPKAAAKPKAKAAAKKTTTKKKAAPAKAKTTAKRGRPKKK